jgi:hypothetical protein
MLKHSWLLLVQLNTVASVADLNEWVENADRWVSGFLEKFEEGCHVMVHNLLVIQSAYSTTLLLHHGFMATCFYVRLLGTIHTSETDKVYTSYFFSFLVYVEDFLSLFSIS